MDGRRQRAGGDRLRRAGTLMQRSASILRARGRPGRRTAGLLLAALLVLLPEASPIRGEDWLTIASGVEYRGYVLAGPVRAYVARMALDQQDVIVESSIGGGDLSGTLEPVSEM